MVCATIALGIFSYKYSSYFIHVGGVCDDSVRHGHRQVRRSVRCAPVDAEVHRGLLSGIRASGERRTRGCVYPLLLLLRRRQAAQDD